MEEKKLTNEEVVKDIEHSTGMPSYWKKIVLDLIQRLRSENESLKKQIDELPKPRKKILANRVYSDSTLKKWSKEDLIEQIRILEHNWSCAEESFANSVKNADKIFYEQKAEIERLTERVFDCTAVIEYNEKCSKEIQAATILLERRNNEIEELQKQVEELTVRTSELFHELQEEKRAYAGAVKDTAKEIWSKGKHFYNQYPLSTEVGLCCLRDWIKKRYGVEVE